MYPRAFSGARDVSLYIGTLRQKPTNFFGRPMSVARPTSHKHELREKPSGGSITASFFWGGWEALYDMGVCKGGGVCIHSTLRADQ